MPEKKHWKIRNAGQAGVAQPRKKFWQFRNATGESAELLLYGDISNETWWGDEATPRQFSEDLNKLGVLTAITVRINSGGGDVFAASAIGNLLEQHPAEVTAKIDGLCASAATIVACHCNKVVAAKDSIYMIHPAKIGMCGYVDAETMQQYLDALTAIRENIVTLYARKTGRDKEEVGRQMDETSWWTGEEAKDNGFVDELIEDEEQTVVENRNGIIFVNSVDSGFSLEKAPKFVQDTLAAAPAVKCFVNKPASTPGTPSHKEEKTMDIKTVDDLRRAFPDLVNEIETAAAEQAATAERQRIRDIEEMCLTGSEDFANEAKFEKPISASEYAVQAVKNAKQAEGKKGQEHLNSMRNDYEGSGMKGVKSEAIPPKNDEFMDAIKSVGSRK